MKTRSRGKIFTLDHDRTGDDRIDVNDLEWSYLDGDGDFRSGEVMKLRDEADIIITNPPFSLFREFLTWIIEADKQFAIIGNMNSITYKEVFRHIMADEMWLGATANGSDMVFAVPPGTAVKERDKAKAARLGYEGDFTRLGNACWFTTLDHGRRHQPLTLMTMAENKKYSRHKEIKGVGYPRYYNFDAIEVSFTDAIPSDYPGVMGVPITFLSKYNPEQFEILGNMDDHELNRTLGVKPISESFIKGYRASGGTGAQRAGGYWVGLTHPHRFPFKRIFIRHRKKET